MRIYLFSLVLGYSLNLFAQSEFDTIGFPLKAVCKLCSSNLNDTAYKYIYSYNKFNLVVKYEKYDTKSPLNYFYTYNYDSSGNYINEQGHTVFKFVKNSIYDEPTNWARDIIGVYGMKNGASYSYDTINEIIIISSKLYINKKHASLTNTLLNTTNDTALFFEYYNDHKLKKIINIHSNRFTLVKYKYKGNSVIEYHYNPKKQKLAYTITLTYNNKNKLIRKFTDFNDVFISYKWYYFKKVKGHSCLINYLWENDKLVTIEKISMQNDDCAAECCNNYKLILQY